MESNTHQQLLRSVRESQQRSKRTLQLINGTLSDVKGTIKDIQQTNNNIDSIKKQYSDVMDKLALQVANAFNLDGDQPFKKKEGVYYQKIARHNIQQKIVARELIRYNQILILTGAGVSAPSGIPTFRGKNGLYDRKFISKKIGLQMTPQNFITKVCYSEQPQSIWQWIDQIHEMASVAKANQIHHEIDLLANLLSKLGNKVVVATQNIDDLHTKPKLQQYEYYNIHGNCKQVRCSNHHFYEYSQLKKDGIILKRQTSNCRQCEQPLVPHLLFFDQTYGKNYGLELLNRQFKLVIVIGSSVKTGLAIRLIRNAELVIEINPQPVIQIGNVYAYTSSANEILRKIRHQVQLCGNK